MAPWTPDRFAQLDLFLAPNAFKNCVKDVESRPDIAVNSDHVIVIAKLQLKLKAIAQPRTESVSRFFPPSRQQETAYNAKIRELFLFTEDQGLSLFNCSQMVAAMKCAATQTLSRKHRQTVRAYITDSTWKLIEERQKARMDGRTQEEKLLNRDIARQARKDKQAWKI